MASAVMGTLVASRLQAGTGTNTVDYFYQHSDLDTPANFSTGAVPTGTNDATFNTSYPSSAAATFILSAETLTAGSLDDLNQYAITIDNPTTNSANSTITLGASGLQNNTSGAALADLIYVASGSTLNILGPNAGSGSGVLNVVLGATGNFDAAASNSTLNISSVISGNYGLNITGAGLVVLSGNNTFTGLTNISNGTLQIPGTSNTPLGKAGILFSGNSVLQFGTTGNTSTTFAPASFNIASGVTATLNTNGVSYTFLTTAFTGTGNFTKSGLGTLQMGVNNPSYLGTYTIAGGIAEGGSATDFGSTSSGTITIDNGAELIYSAASGGTTTFGQTVNIGVASTDIAQISAQTGDVATFSKLAGPGTLNAVGPGVLVITGTSAFTGNINVSGGAISVDSSANTELGPTTATQVFTLNGGTFNYSSASSATINGANRSFNIGASGGNINANNAAGVLSIFLPVTPTTGLTTSGALTISGAGTVLLQNPADAGFPVILGSSASGSTSTLMFTATATSIGSLASGGSGGASLVLGYNKGSTPTVLTIGTDGTSTSYSGTISDKPANQTSSGSIIKVGGGTLILSGSNTYTGGTNISAGTLVANTIGSGNSSTGTGTVNISGGTLAGGTKAAPGQITGAVVVNSGGFITAGTGKGTSDTVGTLNTSGGETWNAGGTYAVKIGASSSDLLILSGLTSSGGTFNINVVGLTGNSVTPTTYVIANDTGGGSTAFNVSGITYALNTSGSAPAVSYFSLSEVTDGSLGAAGTGLGGEDLILTDTAPEPTSFLLLGAVASPLLLGRRRRV